MKRTLLDNRHPDYTALSPDWLFWAQSYNGGAEYAKGNHLFKYTRETDKSYEERLKRADRNNFTRQVLDLIVQYLFKENPSRKKDKAGDAVANFWENVDGKGTKIDDFMKLLATNVGIFGAHYVVVDKPQGKAITKAQQQALGLNPYVYMVSPLDVLDVVFNGRSGEIEQILIRETTRGEVDLRTAREGDSVKTVYRLWYKDGGIVKWTLYEKDEKGDLKTLEDGQITINKIPIVKVTRGNSTYGGASVIGDIATLDRSVYNYNSCCDQIIYDQTFSTLALEFDGQMKEFFEDWGIILGTKSIIPYPKGGQLPQFISPDASQGEFILKRIDQKVTQIYQVQNLQDTQGATQQGKPQQVQSGVAKGWDFEKLNAGLCEFGDVLEKGDEAIAALVKLWDRDETPVEADLIDYPESFDVKSLTDELTEYNMLSSAVSSETYRKFLEKNLVKKASPKLEQAEQKTINAEIDGSQDLELEAQKLALKLQSKQPPKV